MGLSVSSLVGFRTATTQMNVHFLGPVREGRIICRSEVVHRTRQKATAEGRVFDGEGNLVAMGTGSFRIFEKQGNPIVQRGYSKGWERQTREETHGDGSPNTFVHARPVPPERQD